MLLLDTISTNNWQELLQDMFELLKNLGLAVGIMIAGWIIAKFLSSIIGKILTKLQVDKLGDKLNNIEALHSAKIKINLITIAKKFVYWMVMLIFTLIAVDTLGLTIVSQKLGELIGFLPQVLIALVIFGIGFYVADIIKGFVASVCRSFGVKSWKIISTVVFLILVISVAVTALNQVGINTDIITTNVTLVLGGILLAFGVAYGLAARNVLASMLATFYNKDKYQVGQMIEVDGHKGHISEMDTISFTLDTGDQKVVFPLNRLLNEKVIIYPKEGQLTET